MQSLTLLRDRLEKASASRALHTSGATRTAPVSSAARLAPAEPRLPTHLPAFTPERYGTPSSGASFGCPTSRYAPRFEPSPLPPPLRRSLHPRWRAERSAVGHAARTGISSHLRPLGSCRFPWSASRHSPSTSRFISGRSFPCQCHSPSRGAKPSKRSRTSFSALASGSGPWFRPAPLPISRTPSGPGPRGSQPRHQGPGCRPIHPARPAPTRLAFPVVTTSVLGSPLDIPLLEPLPGIPSPPMGARPHARPSSGRTAHLKTGALPNDASSPFPADRAPADLPIGSPSPTADKRPSAFPPIRPGAFLPPGAGRARTSLLRTRFRHHVLPRIEARLLSPCGGFSFLAYESRSSALLPRRGSPSRFPSCTANTAPTATKATGRLGFSISLPLFVSTERAAATPRFQPIPRGPNRLRSARFPPAPLVHRKPQCPAPASRDDELVPHASNSLRAPIQAMATDPPTGAPAPLEGTAAGVVNAPPNSARPPSPRPPCAASRSPCASARITRAGLSQSAEAHAGCLHPCFTWNVGTHHDLPEDPPSSPAPPLGPSKPEWPSRGLAGRLQ